jgi:predicted TIM-barrel fold metal-dependent hydrolase
LNASIKLITPSSDRVKQNYWPSNYSTDSTAAAIMPSKVVFMEAAVNQSLNVKEAEWVQGLAEMQVSRPEIGAIVAYVPIEEGAKCEAVVKEVRCFVRDSFLLRR